MDGHNFRIGDKVRLRNPKSFLHIGTRILTIVDVDCGDIYIPVWYEGIRNTYFPLKPSEIEYVSRKGQQLLFKFMT